MTLSQYLTQRGLTDQDAGNLFGIHRSQISRYRRNVALPSLKTALAIKRQTGGAVGLDSWDWQDTNGGAA